MTITRRKCVLTAFATLLVAAAIGGGSANAGTSGFDVTIGLSGGAIPRYEGSDRLTILALPEIDVTWRDTLFANTSQGAGFYAINHDRLQLGASLGYDFGRRERHDRQNLRGMGNIDDAALGMVFAGYSWLGLDFSISVARTLGGARGTVAEAGLAYPVLLGERLVFVPNLSASWADDKHMSSYFGVSQSQASRSGYARYTAAAGIKDVGVGFQAVYGLNNHWTLNLGIHASYLLDEAAESPLVQERLQPSGGVGIVYRR
ncbi:hypothetical protein CAI21_08835 [Alkalilimnicola ehrlichii]|uniref:MltA-interacting MipA family protein n=1 Tax=Alkalilimnicola ehrlichii TaxID=351052 RepID=A0A3E0WVT0_9GAMM|nr:MipA/OmpV family protein [Alkalilimnicola ehrlichii]RFA29921.1 hypothetical protein CAI21_08835 [Alkalilimnicola ehrlichii]RFA36509.1 hypothetical protein CAL65_11110 [Alkalilimnicola ehrlichii]